MQIIEHTVFNGSVHTAYTQYQRICMQICAQMGFRVLCELVLILSQFAHETVYLIVDSVFHHDVLLCAHVQGDTGAFQAHGGDEQPAAPHHLLAGTFPHKSGPRIMV